MVQGEKEPTGSSDAESVFARLSSAAKNLMISSSSIFLALALSKVLKFSSSRGGAAWWQRDGIPRGVFSVMSLLAILTALKQIDSLLSCYSNKPNKLWILSGACGHVIGFILVSKTVAFAELLQIAAQGRFVELLYSMVVVSLGFFFV